MKKTNRTKEQAEEIVTTKIFKYITAVNMMYMKRYHFDADLIETTLIDSTDSVFYFKQQDDIKRSFCINSSVWQKLSLIRYEGGTRIPVQPIFKKLAKYLRVKSYNQNNTASYCCGKYSKMYIFNYDTFITICAKWLDSTEYKQAFDLKSDYYKDIIDVLMKNYELKFFDFNKYKFRKDGSN